MMPSPAAPLLAVAVAAGFAMPAIAQQTAAFPDPDWSVESPEAHGLDSARLEAAAAAASEIGAGRDSWW